MGCGSKGFDEIKKHPFFSRINWSRLETLQLTPPFTPDPDTLNFNVNLELQSHFGHRKGSVIHYSKPKKVQRAFQNPETIILIDHFKTFNETNDYDESGYDLADQFTPVRQPNFGSTVSVDVRKQKVINLSEDNTCSVREGIIDGSDDTLRRRRVRLRPEMIEIQDIDFAALNR